MTTPAGESERLPPASPGSRVRQWRWIVALVLVLAIGLGYYFFGRHLSLESLAAREAALRDFQQQRPVVAYSGAFVIYVVVTGLSLPGAALLSLFYGWLFGPVAGVILVSFASTLGATIAFSVSRYLFRDAIQRRYQQRLETLNAAVEAEGAYYLFTLRLIPVIPFFLVNLLMGLTPIRLWTFWWVSQVGMLAGTIVYVGAGASLPSMSAIEEQGLAAVVRWPTLVAFALLGALPLIAKRIVKRLRRSP